jgi:phage shock protein C
MYCSCCGRQIEAGARFCSACGTALGGFGFTRAPLCGQLSRPRHPRVIGGVCSGLALHYGWDVSLVRILWVLCVLFAGTGVLAYIIAWIVIPEEPYLLPNPGAAATVGTPGHSTGTVA